MRDIVVSRSYEVCGPHVGACGLAQAWGIPLMLGSQGRWQVGGPVGTG